MFSTTRHIEDRNVRIFHSGINTNTDSFHLIATNLDVLLENPDSLSLYMAFLWNKIDTLATWDNERFNCALNWLVDKGAAHPVFVSHYHRK